MDKLLKTFLIIQTVIILASCFNPNMVTLFFLGFIPIEVFTLQIYCMKEERNLRFLIYTLCQITIIFLFILGILELICIREFHLFFIALACIYIYMPVSIITWCLRKPISIPANMIKLSNIIKKINKPILVLVFLYAGYLLFEAIKYLF